MSSISTAYKTETGHRSENEDSCLVLNSVDLPEGIDALFILADGMGGRASGATASSKAVSVVKDEFIAQIGAGETDVAEVLERSLKAANSAVYNDSMSDPALKGMGTTCVTVAVRDDKAYFAHLGDSRAYLLRDGKLTRLTEDHSFVAEKVKSRELTEDQARKSRFRNVITRAVGLEADAQPDVGSISVSSGDVLLICSDGLSNPVKESNIADILCTSSNPGEACDQLVSAALWDGGQDNITVIVAAFGVPVHVKSTPPVQVQSRRRGGWVLPAFLGMLIGMGLAVYPGQSLITKFVKPEIRTAVRSEQPDLSRLEYGNPELILSHVPLQGRIIAIDRSGFLYVADVDGRLMRVDTSGRIDPKYPVRNTFKFFVPTHAPMLASDEQGNIYIADPAGRRILKFAASGSLLTLIGVGKLESPEALAVDKNGNIYVVDDGRLKVIKARQPGEANATVEGTPGASVPISKESGNIGTR